MSLLSGEIAEQVRKELADLAGPVRLVVFTQEFECEFCAETRQLVEEIAQLSDCPYCPNSVVLAHQMAIASPLVRADMVEAMEFPHLALKYQVMGVPRTVINETVYIEGAAPESMVLEKLQEALSGAQELSAAAKVA